MEVRLRDLLLDIEDRIHQGTLGTLKVHTHRVAGLEHITCLCLTFWPVHRCPGDR